MITTTPWSEAKRRAHVAICESKARFGSKKIAKLWCKRSTRMHGDPRLHPYQCNVCGLWHTTTRSK